MFTALRMIDRIERRDEYADRRTERQQMRDDRLANRDAERHFMHMQRLGYDPRGVYGAAVPMQSPGYMYPPQGPGYNAGYAGPGPYGPPSGYASPLPTGFAGPPAGYGAPSPYAAPYGSSMYAPSPAPYAVPRGSPSPLPYAPPHDSPRAPTYTSPPGPPPNMTRATPVQQRSAGYAEPQKYSRSPSPAPPEYYAPGIAYVAQNGVAVQHEDTRKTWFELDEGKRKALSSGGLVIGLTAIAGGAYYVYKKHKKEGEAMKAQAWEVQNWMMESNQKTERFLNNHDGPREPTTWAYSAHIDDVERDLIPGGESGGQPWYIARAPHDGGLLVGKCRPEVGAVIGANREAVHVKAYDILIGNPHAVKWVAHRGPLTVSELQARPVEGGYESDGTRLAIARARVNDNGMLGIGGSGIEGVFPGKVSSKWDGAYVTVGEREIMIKEYEVLCYA